MMVGVGGFAGILYAAYVVFNYYIVFRLWRKQVQKLSAFQMLISAVGVSAMLLAVFSGVRFLVRRWRSRQMEREGPVPKSDKIITMNDVHLILGLCSTISTLLFPSQQGGIVAIRDWYAIKQTFSALVGLGSKREGIDPHVKSSKPHSSKCICSYCTLAKTQGGEGGFNFIPPCDSFREKPEDALGAYNGPCYCRNCGWEELNHPSSQITTDGEKIHAAIKAFKEEQMTHERFGSMIGDLELDSEEFEHGTTIIERLRLALDKAKTLVARFYNPKLLLVVALAAVSWLIWYFGKSYLYFPFLDSEEVRKEVILPDGCIEGTPAREGLQARESMDDLYELYENYRYKSRNSGKNQEDFEELLVSRGLDPNYFYDKYQARIDREEEEYWDRRNANERDAYEQDQDKGYWEQRDEEINSRHTHNRAHAVPKFNNNWGKKKDQGPTPLTESQLREEYLIRRAGDSRKRVAVDRKRDEPIRKLEAKLEAALAKSEKKEESLSIASVKDMMREMMVDVLRDLKLPEKIPPKLTDGAKLAIAELVVESNTTDSMSTVPEIISLGEPLVRIEEARKPIVKDEVLLPAVIIPKSTGDMVSKKDFKAHQQLMTKTIDMMTTLVTQLSDKLDGVGKNRLKDMVAKEKSKTSSDPGKQDKTLTTAILKKEKQDTKALNQKNQ